MGHSESQLCFFGWALLCVWDLGWSTWTHPAPCSFLSPSRLTWPCSHERAGIQETEWKYIGPHEAWFRSNPLISKSQDQFKCKQKGNGLHISMGRMVVHEYKRRRTVVISTNDLPHSPLWSKLSRTFLYEKDEFHLTPPKASYNQVFTLGVWILLVNTLKFFAATHSGNNDERLYLWSSD